MSRHDDAVPSNDRYGVDGGQRRNVLKKKQFSVYKLAADNWKVKMLLFKYQYRYINSLRAFQQKGNSRKENNRNSKMGPPFHHFSTSQMLITHQTSEYSLVEVNIFCWAGTLGDSKFPSKKNISESP
jgi:hypothetical protein